MTGRLIPSRLAGVRVLLIAFAATALICTAVDADDGPRVVKNPYAQVNWDAVNAYRANFHAHTVRSDGRAEPGQLIHNYAEAGYHVLSITDHDNYYTHRDGERDVIAKYIHRDQHDRVPTSETTWPWDRWIDQEPSAIWVYRGIESSAFFPDLGEQGMLAVRGAELTSHPHMQGLFAPCGWPHRDQTNDDRIQCVQKHGGLAYWAHPTHYAPDAPWEDRYFDDPDWEQLTEYFGDYIVRYDALLGFEVSTRGERLDRDRELFDRLLQRYYPEHDIFIKASDDTHSTSVSDTAPLTIILAEELTEEAIREAMIRGQKFAGTRTETYPEFNRISVDEDANTITLDIDNYDRIVWIKNGQEHTTGHTLDYTQMSGAVLRFEVEQNGATFLSQGFYID